jgi:uncharacterized protein YrrD
MRASQLRGLAVVSIAEATKEGTVQDVVLEPNRRRMAGLSVRPTGGGNDKALSVKDLHSVGRDAITIRDAEALREEPPARGNGEVYLSRLKGMKAMTDTGQIIGTIAEVEIDPTNFAIIGYELSTGVISDLTGNRRKLPADGNIHYGRDVLIVRESAAAAPTKEGRAEEKAHSQ